MPTILPHAVAGAAIAQILAPCSRKRELTLIAAACAMLPDADSIGFRLGIHYGDFWGHRGFTHSLLFACVVALGVMAALWNKTQAAQVLQTGLCTRTATS